MITKNLMCILECILEDPQLDDEAIIGGDQELQNYFMDDENLLD